MNRKISTISKTVGNLLVDQISRELYNCNVYRYFSNFCYTTGLHKLANYYKQRSNEEFNHHEWISQRLTLCGFEFVYPEVPAISKDHIVNDVSDTFDLTIDLEIDTTKWVDEIVTAALEEKDYQTHHWLLNSLVAEQAEEEILSKWVKEISIQDTDWLTREDAILQYYNNLKETNLIKPEVI